MEAEPSVEITIDEGTTTPRSHSKKDDFTEMEVIITNNIRQIHQNAVLLTEYTSKYEISVTQSSNRQIMSDIHDVIENHRAITSKICHLITKEKQRISKSYQTNLSAMLSLLKSFQESLEFFQLAVRILNDSIRDKQQRQIEFLSHDENAEDSASQNEKDTLNRFSTLQREEWIAAQLAYMSASDGRPLQDAHEIREQFNGEEIGNIERSMKEIESLHDHLNVFAEDMLQKQQQNLVQLLDSTETTAAVSDEARKCRYWFILWVVLVLILVFAAIINAIS